MLILDKINTIITQNNKYQINIKTITSVQERALVNSINIVFSNVQRINCWFHLKENLVREALALGLMNKKTKI